MAENILAKQVGPLPVGAWVAVVGGGLALAFYANRTSGGGGAEPSEDVLLAEPGVGLGGGQFIESPPQFVPTGTTTETLDDWVNRAILYLVGKGKSPLTANNAVKKFAQGESLTDAEQELVNLAIQGVGLPPAGQLPEPSPLTPTPSPTTTARYTLTATIPGTRKAGTSIRIRGRVLKGGKAPGGVVIYVYIKKPPAGSNPWLWRKTTFTRVDGTFDFSLSFPSRSSFHVQVRAPGGVSVSRYVQST